MRWRAARRANACMAELFGKATGCSRGLGGSMHYFDKANHMYGGHAIVGAHIPLATGMAFASKYRERRSRHALLLRRRRHQSGRISRGVQSRCALQAAGHLHLREQPLRDGDERGALDFAEADRRSGGRLRHAGLRGRRDEFSRRPRQAHRGGRFDSQGSASGIRRDPDLPLPRPLDVGSGELSHEGSARESIAWTIRSRVCARSSRARAS